jgi:DNA-binding HxlR family transcriptional regulator
MALSKERSKCPISGSLDIWGDKWTLLIIRDLMFSNKCTYGDFLKSPEGIATNILASRLQILEENGIIKKLDHPESKAKFLYQLTQKGMDLLPILVEIYLWADKYFVLPEEIKATVEAGKMDKEGFIQFMSKELGNKMA